MAHGKIVNFFTIPALALNFVSAILITVSSAVYSGNGVIWQDRIPVETLRLVHPNCLVWGLRFLIAGFAIQLIVEIWKARQDRVTRKEGFPNQR